MLEGRFWRGAIALCPYCWFPRADFLWPFTSKLKNKLLGGALLRKAKMPPNASAG